MYVVDREHTTCYEDSIPMCVFQEFLAYPNVAEVLKEFCVEKETNVTVLMGLHIDGNQIQQDIAVILFCRTWNCSEGVLLFHCPHFVHFVQRMQRSVSTMYVFLFSR
jgi:hypothetical protein